MVLVKFKATLAEIASVRLTRRRAGDEDADLVEASRGGHHGLTSSRGFGASRRRSSGLGLFGSSSNKANRYGHHQVGKTLFSLTFTRHGEGAAATGPMSGGGDFGGLDAAGASPTGVKQPIAKSGAEGQ